MERIILTSSDPPAKALIPHKSDQGDLILYNRHYSQTNIPLLFLGSGHERRLNLSRADDIQLLSNISRVDKQITCYVRSQKWWHWEKKRKKKNFSQGVLFHTESSGDNSCGVGSQGTLITGRSTHRANLCLHTATHLLGTYWEKIEVRIAERV